MRVVRASAGLLLTAAVSMAATVVLPVATASATTLTPPAVKTNWYWAEKSPVVGGSALPALPDPADAAANVPAGDVSVGLTDPSVSAQDRVAAIGLDLTTVPLGATFSRFTMTVPLDAASPAVQTETARISACENIDVFQDATGPTALAKAPPISSLSCVAGVFDAAKGYTFDLTAMANDWSGGAPSDGVSLIPTAGAKPFTVVLKGKNGITTVVDYALPATVISDPAVDVPPAPEVAVVPPLLPRADLPGFAPSVPDASVQQPLVTAPLLPQPQVNPAPSARRIIASAGYVAPTGVPSTNWWLALLVGLTLLGLTRVVLADPMAPAPVDARRRRFADVVRAGSTTAQH